MNDEKRTAPANAEAEKKMIIKRYDCKTGEVTESRFVYGFQLAAQGSFTADKG